MGAGLWGAVGILASLIEREKTGRGGVVETSLFETAVAWAAIQIASVLIAPRVMRPQGSGASGIVPYQAFRASDGWIVIGAGNDNLFAKFVNALGIIQQGPEGALPTVGLPLRSDGIRPAYERAALRLGEHDDELPKERT